MLANDTVSGIVWEDLNTDGVRGGLEAGVSNVTVNLINSSNAVIATQLTNGSGGYSFTGLTTGSSYSVEVIPPTGFAFSPADQVPPATEATDSDIDNFTGRTTPFTLNVDQVRDAGLSKIFVVDIGDVSVVGSSVASVSGSVDVVLSVPTGFSDAISAFNAQVVAGSAAVSFAAATAPANPLFTPSNPLTFNTNPLSVADNASAGQVAIADGKGLFKINFTVAPNSFGTHALNFDSAGLNAAFDGLANLMANIQFTGGTITVTGGPPVGDTLSGTVWEDLNTNGVREGGELGVSGVTVNVLDSLNTIVATQNTSAGGSYNFTTLAAGGPYRVQVAAPSGFGFSPQNQGSDAVDSDVDGAGSSDSFLFNSSQTRDAGLARIFTVDIVDANVVSSPTLTVPGFVDVLLTVPGGFSDAVAAYNTQVSITGPGGVTLTSASIAPSPLFAAQTPTTVSTSPFSVADSLPLGESSVTNGLGLYRINFDVAPNTAGLFNLNFFGLTGLFDGAGNAVTNANFTGGTINVTASPPLGDTISGTVWNDFDTDGIRDLGELPQSGVTVNVRDSLNAIVATQVTNGIGVYTFSGLPSGVSYTVEVVPPSGLGFGPQDQGVNDAIDSDVNGVGLSNPFLLTGNQTRDAGLAVIFTVDISDATIVSSTSSTVSGFVDVSVFLPPGLADAIGAYNSEIVLSGPGGVALQNAVASPFPVFVAQTPLTVTTTPTLLVFDGSLSGEAPLINGQGLFRVPFDVAANTVGTFNLDFVPGAFTALFDGAGNLLTNVLFSGGQINVTAAPLGDVEGLVWDDLDADGVRDGGEPALAGVTVNVRDSSNAIVASQVTNGTGTYSFGVLALTPGDSYTLEVVPLAGYGFGPQDQGSNDAVDSDVDSLGKVPFVFTGGMVLDAGMAKQFTIDIGDAIVIGSTVSSVTGFVDVSMVVPAGLSDAIAAYNAEVSLSGPGGFSFLATGEANDALFVGQTPNTFSTFPTLFVADNLVSGEAAIADGKGVFRINFEIAANSFGTYDLDFVAGAFTSLFDGLGIPVTNVNFTGGQVIVTNTADVDGIVWNDVDTDGIRDGGELGVANVTVNLRDSSNAVVATDVTDGGGAYSFPAATAGVGYTIEVIAPAGFGFSPQDQGGNDAVDSDVSGAGTVSFVLLTDTTVDAGLAGLFTVDIQDVTIQGSSSSSVSGFVDVILVVPSGFSDAVGAYNATVQMSGPSGLTFDPAGEAAGALFAGQTPSTFSTSPTLQVFDNLTVGENAIANGQGLFRINFTVAANTSGTFNLDFVPGAFTALFDGLGLELSNAVFTGGQVHVVPGVSITDELGGPFLEGTAADTVRTFNVNLSYPSSEVVSVVAFTIDGTATFGDQDYVPTIEFVTFNPGETSKPVTVTVLRDAKVESAEGFFVGLFGANNAVISPGGGLGTVLNDDSATISVSDVTVAEGSPAGVTAFTFDVTLSAPVDQAVSLVANTADGTATVADLDYGAVVNQAINFAANTVGPQTQTVTVNVNQDLKVEANEAFQLLLSGLVGQADVSVSDSSGDGSITNDDSAFISIDDVVQLEGSPSGTTSYVFTVSLSAPVDSAVTINASTADGTGTLADNDYLSANAVVTFAANTVGPQSQTVVVSVNQDTTFEPDETFFVNLNGVLAPSVFVADGQGVGTIQNDDSSDAIAPRVAGVFVRGTDWSTSFLNLLDPLGRGYAVPAGVAQADPLPWVNIDQFVITFTENVSVQQGDLAVFGKNIPVYGISNFSYDSSTWTAVWTLNQDIGPEKILLDLDGNGANPVVDDAGNILDGDWLNGFTPAFPSGDGDPGDDFEFRINILPGDVNQSFTVFGGDVLAVRNAQFKSVGDVGYSPLLDVDGSGSIFGGDVLHVRNRQFTLLPLPPGPLPGPIPGSAGIPSSDVTSAMLSDLTGQKNAKRSGDAFDEAIKELFG